MSDHQMIILTPRRRRGRPRSSDPRVSISAWIPARHYDRLNRIANERDISVSAVVSKIVERVLGNQEKSIETSSAKKA